MENGLDIIFQVIILVLSVVIHEVTHGHVGYLREAYHGEPYVTKFLCREAFESTNGAAQIPAAVLKERLSKALAITFQREVQVYGLDVTRADLRKELQPVMQSYADFVELCERKEKETGEPVTIVASC